MNPLLAISLGLAPVPPLPPEVRARQNKRLFERANRISPGRMPRTTATGYRARIVQALRDTGSGTTADLAAYFETTGKALLGHLQRLERDGQVLREVVPCRGNRMAYVWSASDAPTR